jgi:hypothetical protein
MERETGFEPATPSLEGWRSTTELFPHREATGRPERSGSRATPLSFHSPRPSHGPSAPRWWRGEDLNPRRRSPADLQSAPFGQLGYLAIRTVDSSGTHSAGRRPALVAKVARARPDPARWSWRRESNPRPAAYKAAALPLSYASKRQNFILCIGPIRVNPILRRSSSAGRLGPGSRAAPTPRAGAGSRKAARPPPPRR